MARTGARNSNSRTTGGAPRPPFGPPPGSIVDPLSLRIVNYPDPVLLHKAMPITGFGPEVEAVARRMVDLMFEAEGIGLAAPQVGLPWRLFVCHVPAYQPDPKQTEGERVPARSPDDTPPTATRAPRVYINPVISGFAGPLLPYEEGCLSLPDITGEVLRPERATIRAFDEQGREFTQEGAGLLARCWQHELDHLEGVLILSRMSQVSRMKARGAVRDLEKRAAR